MNTKLSMALEELNKRQETNQAERKLVSFESALIAAEMTAEFEHYSKHYNQLVDVAHALESQQEILNKNQINTDATNYVAIAEIVNTLAKSAGIESTSQSLISCESWTSPEATRSTQREITLEKIGSLLRKMWEAIKRFLLGIYNWIKNLLGWQKTKVDKLQEEAEEVSSDMKIMDRAAIRAKVKAKDTNGNLTVSEFREAIKSKSNKSRRFNTKIKIMNPVFDDKLAEEIKEVLRHKNSIPASFAKEDYNGGDLMIDSVFSILSSLEKEEVCYNSSKAKYLVSAAKAQVVNDREAPASIDDILAAISATALSYESYLTFLEKNFMGGLKNSVLLLTKSEPNPTEVKQTLLKLLPTASDIMSVFKLGKIKDNQFSIGNSNISFYEDITFSASPDPKAVIESIEQNTAIGGYLSDMKFSYTSSQVSGNPLLRLPLDIDTRRFSITFDKYTKTLFDLFSSLSNFSARYQNVLSGFSRAVSRLSDKEDDQSKSMLLFSRVVLHSANVYVNQPLSMMNSHVSNMLDALIDYSDSYLTCKDPMAILSQM